MMMMMMMLALNITHETLLKSKYKILNAKCLYVRHPVINHNYKEAAHNIKSCHTVTLHVKYQHKHTQRTQIVKYWNEKRDGLVFKTHPQLLYRDVPQHSYHVCINTTRQTLNWSQSSVPAYRRAQGHFRLLAIKTLWETWHSMMEEEK